MLMSEPVREKYKWVLLVFLFVAFFLELGSRQLYNAVLPQIRLEFLRLGVTDAQSGQCSLQSSASPSWARALRLTSSDESAFWSEARSSIRPASWAADSLTALVR